MPDPIETQETETLEIETPKVDDRKAAYAERDAAKKRAREAERRAEELAAKLAEHEAIKAAEAEELARKKNDFAAIEAKLKAALEKEKAEKAEALSAIAARDRREREAALVDAVAAKLGFSNRTVLKGVLKELAEQGVDTAPESLDSAADVAKQVREALGDLIPAKSGGSPGTPGVNLTTKKPGEKPEDSRAQRIAEMQKRRSRA